MPLNIMADQWKSPLSSSLTSSGYGRWYATDFDPPHDLGSIFNFCACVTDALGSHLCGNDEDKNGNSDEENKISENWLGNDA
jgi:hypothetical protein